MELDFQKIVDCEVCGNTRHIRNGRRVSRCECFVEHMRNMKVRALGLKSIECSKHVIDRIGESIVLVGGYEHCQKIVGGVVYASPVDFGTRVVAAYDIAEHFLGHVEDDVGIAHFCVSDLLVVFLAFNSMTNRVLGDMIVHIVQSRRLAGRPTWFAVPPSPNIGKLYGAAVKALVNSLPKVKLG